MALNPKQVRVGDLVMGVGTDFAIRRFNPWSVAVRADQTGTVPWGDGEWSGAEWRAGVTATFDIVIKGTSPADWHDKRDQLVASFDAVRTGPDVELEWNWDGRQRLAYGRPRGVDIDPRHAGVSVSTASGAFRILDGTTYSPAEHTVTTGLYATGGGLGAPFGAPVGIVSTAVDGVVEIVNNGIRSAPLLLRITGPVTEPRVSVVGPDEVARTLSLDTVLEAGQWLDIDTEKRTVRLGGTVSRLSDHSGSWPLALPGVSTLYYRAAAHNETSQLTAMNRDRW